MRQGRVWTRWPGQCSSPFNSRKNCSLDCCELELIPISDLHIYCKSTKIHQSTHFRELGRTNLVKLLKKARQKRKRATAADEASGHNGASETLQGAAALDLAVDGAGALDSAVGGAAALSPVVAGVAAVGAAEQGKEEVVPSFEYKDAQALWWAQAGHIRQLSQEASVARAQKEAAEEIEAKNHTF